jgi:hypothetical protein
MGDSVGLAVTEADHVKVWQTVGKLRRRHGLAMSGKPREPGYSVEDAPGSTRRTGQADAAVARPLRPATTLRHCVRLTTAARAKAVAGLDEVTRAALERAEEKVLEDAQPLEDNVVSLASRRR